MKNPIRILFLLLFISPILFGCGMVEEKTQDPVVKEVSEEEINAIIDAMPETQSIIPLTDEFRTEQGIYNLEKYKENAEKATGFNIREYKDYWILENAEEGFGLRLPYDTVIGSRPNENNYLIVFRPNKNAPTDTVLDCSSEMYIHKNKKFDEWYAEKQEIINNPDEDIKVTLISESREDIKGITKYKRLLQDKFDTFTGGLAIGGNNNTYSFVSFFSEEDMSCAKTHEEIYNSIFVINK